MKVRSLHQARLLVWVEQSQSAGQVRRRLGACIWLGEAAPTSGPEADQAVGGPEPLSRL
jgi:hypothetical protein